LGKSLCHKGVNGTTASSESINGNVPFWARKSIRNRVGLAGNQGETGGKITELCSLVAAPGLARQICVDLPLGANAGGSQSEEAIGEPGSRRAIRLSAPATRTCRRGPRPGTRFQASILGLGRAKTREKPGWISALVKDIVPWEEVDAIKSGANKALCVWGIMHYEDMFGGKHYTKFGQILTWPADGKTVMGYYIAGQNDGD
jgi:hypothetical protein